MTLSSSGSLKSNLKTPFNSEESKTTYRIEGNLLKSRLLKRASKQKKDKFEGLSPSSEEKLSINSPINGRERAISSHDIDANQLSTAIMIKSQ